MLVAIHNQAVLVSIPGADLSRFLDDRPINDTGWSENPSADYLSQVDKSDYLMFVLQDFNDTYCNSQRYLRGGSHSSR